MDVRKYWTMCRLHDWFYEYSDDPAVYRAGLESHDQVLAFAAKSDEHQTIYAAWRDHHYGSGPKPAEPKMEEN